MTRDSGRSAVEDVGVDQAAGFPHDERRVRRSGVRGAAAGRESHGAGRIGPGGGRRKTSPSRYGEAIAGEGATGW